MKKIIALTLVSFSLIFAGATLAAKAPTKTPHVAVFKNLSSNAIHSKMAAFVGYVPHIAVFNDPQTHHTFTVNSNGALVSAYPGDKLDFFYYNFPAGPQAMTIISDDGTVVYNDYAPDGAFMHIVSYEGPTSTTYQVVIE